MRSAVRKAVLAAAGYGIAALLGLGFAAQAGELKMDDFKGETVGAVANLCSADQSTEMGKYAIGFCYGWIEGVEQLYAALLEDERFNLKPVACPEKMLTREETRVAFIGWIDANPEARTMPALEGLVRAAKETYPCG